MSTHGHKWAVLGVDGESVRVRIFYGPGENDYIDEFAELPAAPTVEELLAAQLEARYEQLTTDSKALATAQSVYKQERADELAASDVEVAAQAAEVQE